MTRGKRLLSLLLSVLMLCTLLPPRASAAPTLYFTAVNDRMCDLSDETMPFWQNGLLYVAGATVDGPDDLGIRYSYNQEKSVAILYKGQRVLYCDLTAGTMENNRTGEQYAGSPIVRSGMVFFPITALAKMFDLKYSSTKIAYGCGVGAARNAPAGRYAHAARRSDGLSAAPRGGGSGAHAASLHA